MIEPGFLKHYKQELSHLKTSAATFATNHPDIAKTLNLNTHLADDPHVQRLLESFAFLTARIQLKLEEDHSELAESLLRVLYPHFLSSIPAMTLAQLKVDKNHLGPAPLSYAAGSRFIACGKQQERYYFSSIYPVQIWPINLTNLHTDMTAHQCVLHLTLTSTHTFSDLASAGLDTLRFYVDHQQANAEQLYKLLYQHIQKIQISQVDLPPNSLSPVGFADNEHLFAYSANTEEAVSLFTDYCAFPEKFHFFDLCHLANAFQAIDQHTLIIQIYFDHLVTLNNLDKNLLKLDCLPLINLFTQVAQPFKLDHCQVDYPLHPNQSSVEAACEIENIIDLQLSAETHVFKAEPLYHQPYQQQNDNPSPLFYARKKSYLTSTPDSHSADRLYLTFSNLNAELLAAQPIVSATVTCSNQDMSQFIVEKSTLTFKLEDKKSHYLQEVVSLTPLTPKRHWLRQQADYWLCLSLLTTPLNFLSQDKATTTQSFKVFLSRFAAINPMIEQQILPSIVTLHCQPILARRDYSAQLSRGIAFTLTLDASYYDQDSALFFFGTILHRLFTLYSPINAHTTLRLLTQGGKVLFSDN